MPVREMADILAIPTPHQLLYSLAFEAQFVLALHGVWLKLDYVLKRFCFCRSPSLPFHTPTGEHPVGVLFLPCVLRLVFRVLTPVNFGEVIIRFCSLTAYRRDYRAVQRT